MVADHLLLEQCGQHISVDGEIIRSLGDLVGRCLITEDDPEHGSLTKKQYESLLRRGDGSRIPNAGLFPAIQFRARQKGISLDRCITPRIASLPDPVQLEFLRYPQIAEFVCHKPLGQIAVHPGIRPDKIISDLSLAFPNSQIIVLGEHSRQLKQLADKLSATGVRVASISSRYPLHTKDDADEESLPQVICSTPREAANIDFATASIVLLLDSSACQHKSMELTLSQMDATFRLFGLVDVTRRFSPSTVDAIMRTFGPEMLRIQSPGLVRRDVHVAWVSTPRSKVELSLENPGFGLRCYWQHQHRNRRIKQLAERLRSGSSLDHNTYGDVARLYGQSGFHPPSVTVLVERPIHAAELSRLLPDWPVVATNESLNDMPPRFCAVVRRTRRHLLSGTNQIVLTSAASQFRGEVSDIIIWAGGGGSIEAIPHSWFSDTEQSRKPLLIIDFQDQHNLDAQHLSRNRRRAYLQNDIFPVQITAAQGRIAMFLNRQPEEHQ